METEDDSTRERSRECRKPWKQTAARPTANQKDRYRHKRDPTAGNRGGDAHGTGNYDTYDHLGETTNS
jgi:hypothetical protein